MPTIPNNIGGYAVAQSANNVFAGPSSGGSALPTFRALVAADIPSLGGSYQPADATLTAFAALTITANSVSVGTGADAFSQITVAVNQFLARASSGNLEAKSITDAGLSLVAAADAAAMRTVLGIDSNDAVTFGDLTVSNLTVNGTTTTVNSTTLTVDDPLIACGDGNAADSVDLGLYATYTSSGAKYTGIFRDATDGKWRLFTALEEAPTTTVNLAGTGYSVGTLVANLEAATISLTGAITFPDNVRQTFNPGSANAGLNVGSIAGDPSSPSNGDLWYDSAANELTARIAGANVALGAGGGGGASTLDGLTDVVISSPAAGHAFYHDGTTWVNGAQSLLAAGSAAAPMYSFASDPSTGFSYGGGNDIVVSAGGAMMCLFGQGITNFYKGSTNTAPPIISGAKARGSVAAPDPITSGDDLLQISSYGYVGSTGGYVEAASILFDSTGTIANNSTGVGGIIRFFTRAVGGSATEKLTIGDDGSVTLVSGASASELRLNEPSGGGSSYVGFKAPALAGSTVYTLPDALPTVDGQTLSGTTSGVLSWATASGSALSDGDYGDVAVSSSGTVMTVESVSGAFAMTGDITPTSLSTDVNDYNPTNLSTASVLRLSVSGSSLISITGLAGGSDGRVVTLVNVSSTAPIRLVHASTSSSAQNRFALPSLAYLVLNVGSAVTLIYDSTTINWRVLSRAPVDRYFGVDTVTGRKWTSLDLTNLQAEQNTVITPRTPSGSPTGDLAFPVLFDKVTTTDPGTGDDSADGFSVGSIWRNTSNKTIWLCQDNTATAAIWRRLKTHGNTLIGTPADASTTTIDWNLYDQSFFTPTDDGMGNGSYTFVFNNKGSGQPFDLWIDLMGVMMPSVSFPACLAPSGTTFINSSGASGFYHYRFQYINGALYGELVGSGHA